VKINDSADKWLTVKWKKCVKLAVKEKGEGRSRGYFDGCLFFWNMVYEIIV